MFFPNLVSWFYFKDIIIIKSASFHWQTHGAELLYYSLKSTSVICLALLTWWRFFTWVTILTFSLHAKDHFTAEYKVLKLIHVLIWFFEVDMVFKLWTATKVNLFKNDDLWNLICIEHTPRSHIIMNRTPLISYFSMTYANPTSSFKITLFVQLIDWSNLLFRMVV